MVVRTIFTGWVVGRREVYVPLLSFPATVISWGYDRLPYSFYAGAIHLFGVD